MNHTPRGSVGVAMVGALVLLEVTIVVAVLGGGLHQDLTLQRIDTNRAFYAAEAGAAMAAREAWLRSDEDGDGVIGSISDDANPGNDPAVGDATVSVRAIEDDDDTILVAVGTAERARRRVEIRVR